MEIQIRQRETGPEITYDVTYYVGVVPEGRRDEPRLGNVRLIQPFLDGEHVYMVPLLWGAKSVSLCFWARGGIFDLLSRSNENRAQFTM